jgi:hypothetical protein
MKTQKAPRVEVSFLGERGFDDVRAGRIPVLPRVRMVLGNRCSHEEGVSTRAPYFTVIAGKSSLRAYHLFQRVPKKPP